MKKNATLNRSIITTSPATIHAAKTLTCGCPQFRQNALWRLISFPHALQLRSKSFFMPSHILKVARLISAKKGEHPRGRWGPAADAITPRNKSWRSTSAGPRNTLTYCRAGTGHDIRNSPTTETFPPAEKPHLYLILLKTAANAVLKSVPMTFDTAVYLFIGGSRAKETGHGARGCDKKDMVPATVRHNPRATTNERPGSSFPQ